MNVEGKNAVQELLRSNCKVEQIFVEQTAQKSLQSTIELAQKKRVKISIVPKNVMDAQSGAKNHQGIIAKIKGYQYATIDDILQLAKSKNQQPFLLLCDEIADPHNLGSLIRTCECAGVHGLVIPKNRACQVNDTVIKVSTGACFNLKIACVTNLNDCIRYLKKQDISVFSLEADGESMYSANLRGATALVVGSEGFGVSHLTKKLSDGVLSLSMHGKVNSLNASVAGAVAVYEVVRQREESI